MKISWIRIHSSKLWKPCPPLHTSLPTCSISMSPVTLFFLWSHHTPVHSCYTSSTTTLIMSLLLCYMGITGGCYQYMQDLTYINLCCPQVANHSLVWEPTLLNLAAFFVTYQPSPWTTVCYIYIILGENKFLQNFILVKYGPEKRTEIRQRWKNARRLPNICTHTQQMQSSPLVFFHLCLVFVLFRVHPCLTGPLSMFKKELDS